MPLIEPVKKESFKKSILEEPEPKASQTSNDYANLQTGQLSVIPNLVIKKGEVNSPSSYVSLFVQETIPHDFSLGVEANYNSMPKADMDNLSLDIPKPTQLASTQLERAVCHITKEEGAQIWDTSLDGACSKKVAGAGEVFVSPTQECIDSPFILIMQATKDTVEYTATLIIHQVYKSFHEEHPRTRAYKEGVKYKPSLPNKVKCLKIFEVDDQINLILHVFDEPADRHIDQEKEKNF